MRSPAPRHVVRLRLTIVGPLPEIWREVVVDRDLSLGDVRDVIQAVFDGQDCRHHLFTDTLHSPGWSRTRRRWGDRCTMIDLRDPTIIDEATARIGRVLRDARPLYYGHTCESGWLIEIEAFEDDVTAASAPPVQLIAGERRVPFPCCRGAYEYAVLVGVLADPSHPDRDALRTHVEQTIGPWSSFDPEAVDLEDARRRLDLLNLGTPDTSADQRPRRAEPLGWIVDRLPRAARPGLATHLTANALDLPAVVTVEEARAATREIGWVVTRAADGGIPLIDGQADPAVVQAGVEALGCDEGRMLRLIAFAKRGRLVYARGGRLHANKRSAAAARHPTDLWSMLAREVIRSFAPPDSRDLFLLAIADGSLADPAIGARRTAEALALVRRDHRYGSWGYDVERSDECDQACDCPDDGSGTWHDVVARAIRDAAAQAAGDDAAPVASGFADLESRELGFAPEWFHDPAARAYALATRTRGGRSVDEKTMLTELDELIRLLSIVGLDRADEGTWIVPPTLREFARESLRHRGDNRWTHAPY